MRKGFVVVLFLMVGVVLNGQVIPEEEQADSLLSEESTEKEILPDYQSIHPAPNIFRDSLDVLLRDYKIGFELDSLWQKELVNSDLYPKMQKSILDFPQEENMDMVDHKELSEATLKERLEEINQSTPFDIDYNSELEKMIHQYLKRDKTLMERLMSLSRYYFPIFEEALAKYDLPLELKYLPIIESALNPQAKSPVGATGLWQFMFTTGKQQGLTLSSYVDERMDPLKSTEGAAEYLSDLYRIFGDWNLVLAAYNSGPGRVTKAIRRSGGETNFWKLKRFLPRETVNYVPAFMASLYLFHHAEDHGFEPYNPDVVYFETDTIQVKETIKFEQISEVTGIDEDLLSFLNPAYKLNIIPKVKDEAYSVRLPIREAGLFVANEDLIYDYNEEKLANQQLPEYHLTSDRVNYRVKSGDVLGEIAGQHGVTISQIKQWNRLHNNNLRVGQQLVIYPRDPITLADKQQTTKSTNTQKKESDSSEKTYVVQKGDSLWSISRKFNDVTISQIKKWNGIRSSSVKPGMRLKISGG